MRDIRPGTPVPSERPCERSGDVRDFGGQRVATGPCVDRAGQRTTHTAYVYPFRSAAALRVSLIGSTVLAVVIVALFFAGTPVRPAQAGTALRASLSPAPTSSLHSLASFDCAQCHREAGNVEDGRCERCHDTSVAGGLSTAAHVFAGTGNLRRAFDESPVSCTTCHLEHRGEAVRLADVDDRECGACHRTSPGSWTRLTTFGRHPEFALVTSGIDAGSGLRWFNHKLHLRKVEEKFLKGVANSQRSCEACHVREAGQPDFLPISFAAHCAACHEEDLGTSSGGLSKTVMAALGPLPAPLKAAPDIDDPEKQKISGVKHADLWVLRTVEGLRGVVDPVGVAADRLALDREVAQLELQARFTRPAAGAAWSAPPGLLPSHPDHASAALVDRALQETAAALETFAQELQPQDAEAQALMAEASKIARAPAPTAAADGGGVIDRGGADALLQLVDATIARAQAAGDAGLAERAAALRGRIGAIKPGPRSRDVGGAAADRLRPLIEDLRKAADSRLQADAARLTQLAWLADQRGADAIEATAFDRHRLGLLQLLDEVERAAERSASGPAAAADVRLVGIRARAQALRRDVLAATYGLPDDLLAARAQFYRTRELDRARIDGELERAGLRTSPPPEPRRLERMPIAMQLDRAMRRLAATGTTGPVPKSLADADARGAIAALLGGEESSAEANSQRKDRCTLCHELAPGGTRLATVRTPGGSLLSKSVFTHEPHVTADARNCDSCHTDIRESRAARDLNIPDVESCRECHAEGKRAAKAIGCEACHRYHVPSAGALRGLP